MRSEARRTLILLALVCALPVAAAYVSFFLVRPDRTMNYGELIEPKPLPAARVTALDGTPWQLEQLKGRWVLVSVDSGSCDERCRAKLYAMRQVRAAQGKEQDRVERVWLVSDASEPTGRLLQDYPGTRVARAEPALLDALPAADAHLYLIDPLGNVMLRYPENPDLTRMVKDFERLLKYSRIG